MASISILVLTTLAASAAAIPFDSNQMSSGNDEWSMRREKNPSYDLLDDVRLRDGELETGKAVAINGSKWRWPRGVVPFVIDPSIAQFTSVISASMSHIEEKTYGCVTFVPRSPDQADYVRIFQEIGGCWSFVGRQGGAQDLSLGDQICHVINGTVHELAHALGLHHEHKRFDRDPYITIHPENIIPGAENNFDKLAEFEGFSISEFDFFSIMLYDMTAGSKNGLPTITPNKADAVWPPFAQKQGLSAKDAQLLKDIYCCKLLGFLPFQVPCPR